MTDTLPVDPPTKEEAMQTVRQERENFDKLVFDDDGEIVDADEFHRRLEDLFGIEYVTDERGTPYYSQPRDEHDVSEVPTLQASMVVKDGIAPTAVMPMDISVERAAEQQIGFSKAATEAFNQQLEADEDPFPLEAHVE